MDRLTGREAYRVVRDLLVRHRENYDAAVAAYRWPDVGGQFNWARDWFDSVAAGNPRRRDGPAIRSARHIAGRSWRSARRPRYGHAGQSGRTVGIDAGGHETGRGHHAGDVRARA